MLDNLRRSRFNINRIDMYIKSFKKSFTYHVKSLGEGLVGVVEMLMVRCRMVGGGGGEVMAR